MDIDRVPQMNGVGREATPTWPKSGQQRRKPVPTESTGDPEAESAETEFEAAEAQAEDEMEPDEDAEATEGSRINLMA